MLDTLMIGMHGAAFARCTAPRLRIANKISPLLEFLPRPSCCRLCAADSQGPPRPNRFKQTADAIADITPPRDAAPPTHLKNPDGRICAVRHLVRIAARCVSGASGKNLERCWRVAVEWITKTPISASARNRPAGLLPCCGLWPILGASSGVQYRHPERALARWRSDHLVVQHNAQRRMRLHRSFVKPDNPLAAQISPDDPIDRPAFRNFIHPLATSASGD